MRAASLLALALCLTACASLRPPPAPPETPDVPAEIARWEAETRHKGTEAEAHRRLSLLYAHPSLPTPDYRRSLEELEAYLALAPKAAEDPDVKRWLLALRAVRDARRAAERQAQENAALKGENRELQRSLSDARREAREAKEAIEKLKELDLREEHLRKPR